MKTNNNVTTTSSNVPAANPIQSVFGLSNVAIQEAHKSSKLYKTTHGMFASVPLICQVDDCPYKDTCIVDPAARILNQRCPMEVGAIIARYEYWCEHFSIDMNNIKADGTDRVDASLIRDLVENEIQTIRAENKIALNADFIGKTISQVDNKGIEHYEDTVTPEAQYKMTLQDKRYKILNLLNSTRKDKSSEQKLESKVSIKTANIINTINEKLKKIDLDKVVSVDFEPTNDNDASTGIIENDIKNQDGDNNGIS